MREKMLKQAVICLLIAAALFISKVSQVDVLETGADTVLNQMSQDYSTNDIMNMAKKGKETAASFTTGINDAVGAISGSITYGEPIDKEFTGKLTSVYAVGGGEITAVGENEEIGKYVKITHGDRGESLYGNLKSVNVTVPSRVKKGQIIGVYERIKNKDFYYSFREFK